MNRMEELHSLSKKKSLFLLGMKFMVSIGTNPITSIGDEKQFPIGSKWLSIKRGKSYLRSIKMMLLLLQERTHRVSYLTNLHN